jgi:nitroimidazol reductase NimA-like FMN-containing flavoprotein (pyridoxamine 5'-phosphate oxidase superfamily)
MRRFKQQISEAECIRILKEEKRGVLSVMGEDGYPYGIPMNHWYSPEDGKLYFHGAKSGHKLDAISAKYGVDFIISLSMNKDDLADDLQDKVLLAL